MNLSQFSGDKSSWPIYLSIGNISKSTAHRTSTHATPLIAYLPISKLTIFKTDEDCYLSCQHLFHYCMCQVLCPLFNMPKEGVKMTCADGSIHCIFSILAAYLADFPEQALIACTMETNCPKCICPPKEHGDPLGSVFEDGEDPFCDPEDTIHNIQLHAADQHSAYHDHGLHDIREPFWDGLEHCNIFNCITSDILHQLHKGVFTDHISSWCLKLSTKPEIDA